MHIVLTGNTTFKLANFRAGLVQRLIAAGYRVTVLAPPDDYVGAVRDMGCDFVPLSMDRNGTSPIAELALLISIFRTLRRLRPTFVFGYTIKNNIYAGLACRLLGIPFAANVTGLGPAFNDGGLLNGVVRILYRAAFRRAEAVFFQNESDRDIFLAGHLVPSDRVRLLPGSGVNLTRFAFQPVPPHNGSIRFLLVARMLWDKGVGIFADAAEQVRRTHPEALFQLLGPLDPDSKTGIGQHQIDQWVEEGRLVYLGSAADVRPAIEQAHCIVLPSYYREGTPRTLLEAGATGRPAITSDMPGCRDPIAAGVSGILVRPRDSEDLARACVEFLGMSHTAQVEMGRAARERMERDYDERIVIDAYMSLLDGHGFA
ncbi:glycosyltransferase family 4 protein [Sphingopyxis sp. JAI128]|uniref:glycosyltransferase family 4 protein n=1 Tax=Sphingopyxis sp. JAI128 TaxID=2723066 RepID=UPI0017B65D83|nr:glycosyltransferase family 4 protein [Sphingopyxis sp. JAI128]MBB6424403.1 glycosyltransferase involved in cell wall biosynthesis [Sphingopyxis sp. JAI128]